MAVCRRLRPFATSHVAPNATAMRPQNKVGGGAFILIMNLLLFLTLHVMTFIPERTWSSWKEPQDGSYSWYHSLQVAGERFEDHIKTIALLLQKFDQSMKEQVGALDKLASSHIKNLGEWLEDHTRDLNVWLSMYFWALQEFHNNYMKHPDYILAKEMVLRDKCWNEDISKADPWLDYSNSTLYMWLEEAPLIVYKALRMQGSNLKRYTETQIQHIEEHIKFLEQLLDNYIAAAKKWLDDFATVKETSSQNFTWDFFTAQNY
ncbi:uncharacterized protein LOC120301793 [Crotalus tigris]|uniref:uncharacterized protein LOC120301793 n=1 Tax=Crotalus tigris TaxID=88082 RepID=UPI00192F8BA0|nr:uncharacterized protein LOC120301793 [Crotalus tigris]